jgi:hypothetical protein
MQRHEISTSSSSRRRIDATLQKHFMTPPDRDRFNRELEEKSRRNAKPGAGEVAAGAILGGLLGGPFGALFGAQIGSSFSASRAVERARQEEMQRLGVTKEMLEMAEEAGADLERGFEGLKATRESLQTQQSFARRISSEVDELYEKAQAALKAGDEELTRKYLFDRQQRQDKLKKVLMSAAEEKRRLEKMEKNVELLEERAMEVDSLLRRTVGAKALQDTSSQFTLSTEDPLLQKFKDIGID